MSILNFFKRKKPEERGIFLPTPVSTQCISEEEVAACNKEVEAVVVRQQKTKQYHSYKQRADIGSMVPRQHHDNSLKSWDIQSLSQLHANFAICIAKS
jgi:hypothetical protein